MYRSLIPCAALWLALSTPAIADDPNFEQIPSRSGLIIYGDRTLVLQAFPVCNGSPHGAYNIWLVTMDEEEPGVAVDGAPRLHATSDGDISSILFYPGDGAGPLPVIGRGADFVPFLDNELHYSGPIGENKEQQIEIHIKC